MRAAVLDEVTSIMRAPCRLIALYRAEGYSASVRMASEAPPEGRKAMT